MFGCFRIPKKFLNENWTNLADIQSASASVQEKKLKQSDRLILHSTDMLIGKVSAPDRNSEFNAIDFNPENETLMHVKTFNENAHVPTSLCNR